MDMTTLVIAAFAGAAVTPTMQLLKALSAKIDAWPAWGKRLAVAGLAILAIKTGELIGAPIPTEVLSLDGAAVEAVLTTLFAFGYHSLKKQLAK